jgi:catechol 2,3-dioxygenase-like lactoylglutathione lyase family enzyme
VTVNVHPAAPILRVANLSASLDYYVKVLGFTIDWEYPRVIASVSRGQCCIFLSEGDQGNPGSWAWVGVGDAGALFEEYRSKGAKIRHPPTNYSWAYEMQVEDLDGNVLRLGSHQREDSRSALGATCAATSGCQSPTAGGPASSVRVDPGFNVAERHEPVLAQGRSLAVRLAEAP